MREERRIFTEKTQRDAMFINMNKYGGLHCEICKKQLFTRSDFHFDHIVPYKKGGKSILSNCQILCVICNEKKNQKLQEDFLIESEIANILAGKHEIIESVELDKIDKNRFDELVGKFILQYGNISKRDFSNIYNNLPSYHYVAMFYGSLNKMKSHFGIDSGIVSWDRDTIKISLLKYCNENGDIFQKDLCKKNKLPSLPCILRCYPEYTSFSDIKTELCGLHESKKRWDKDTAIEAGRIYLMTHKTIRQKDLCGKNNLPNNNVILRLFGSLGNYQDVLGIELYKNKKTTDEEINSAVIAYFENKERIIKSRKNFFDNFEYSERVIQRIYGDFETFCEKYNIQISLSKKKRYTKKQVDSIIGEYFQNGNVKIPNRVELTSRGLPSAETIEKYYSCWRTPFEHILNIRSNYRLNLHTK